MSKKLVMNGSSLAETPSVTPILASGEKIVSEQSKDGINAMQNKTAPTLSKAAKDLSSRIERRLELALKKNGVTCEIENIKLAELVQIYLTAEWNDAVKCSAELIGNADNSILNQTKLAKYVMGLKQ
jgi:hypothetical protein